MAKKKVLVLTNGQIEQLQPGDFIEAAEIPQLTNDNAGALVIGTPVYSSSNNGVDKARANAVGTANVIGLVADASIAPAAVGGVQFDGTLEATTGEWDAVTGQVGGLVKDTFYYLDTATAGMLTPTAPSTAGQFVACVGIAISTTELKITLQPRIKL